jgi:hypothetical protein
MTDKKRDAYDVINDLRYAMQAYTHADTEMNEAAAARGKAHAEILTLLEEAKNYPLTEGVVYRAGDSDGIVLLNNEIKYVHIESALMLRPEE